MEIITISNGEKTQVTLVKQQQIQGYLYSKIQTVAIEQTTIFGEKYSKVIQLQVKVQCSLFVPRVAAMVPGYPCWGHGI